MCKMDGTSPSGRRCLPVAEAVLAVMCGGTWQPGGSLAPELAEGVKS